MNLPTKILIIANIKRGDSVLLRKKPAGSKPYKETWYSFGCEFIPEQDPAETLIKYIKNYIGIDISVSKHLSWGSEVKQNHDSVTAQFIYLELECDYIAGDIKLPAGLEKVEFIDIKELPTLDIVPPSVKLFKRLGYLQ